MYSSVRCLTRMSDFIVDNSEIWKIRLADFSCLVSCGRTTQVRSSGKMERSGAVSFYYWLVNHLVEEVGRSTTRITETLCIVLRSARHIH